MTPTEIINLVLYVMQGTGLLPVIQVVGVGLVVVAIFRALTDRS